MNRKEEILLKENRIRKLMDSLGLKGIILKKLMMKNLMKILKLKKLAKKIKKHYIKYPKNPADFTNWVKKAEILWYKKEILNSK